jgi:hypothetical protein
MIGKGFKPFLSYMEFGLFVGWADDRGTRSQTSLPTYLGETSASGPAGASVQGLNFPFRFSIMFNEKMHHNNASSKVIWSTVLECVCSLNETYANSYCIIAI